MFFLLISHRSLRFKKGGFPSTTVLFAIFDLSECRTEVCQFFVTKGCKQPNYFISSFVFCYAGAVLAASCSHGRSHEYFTESILTDCPFTAYPCDNYVRMQGLDYDYRKNCLVITQFLTCSLRQQTIHNSD